MAEHARVRGAIDRHFAGRGSREGERVLRVHCASCARCHQYYERHLLLSELDPTALGAQERIARGLGVAGARRLPGVSAIVAMAAAALFWFAPHGASQPQFTARGALPERSAELDVYLVQANGGTRSVPTAIPASAELAFAYASPPGHPYLMVFGVDEHGHVCWYYPEWTDPEADPSGLAISNQPGTFELPEAVSHALDGKNLRLFGLFSAQPWHVRAVEKAIGEALARREPLAAALGQAFGGSVTVERELRVLP